MAGTSWPNLVAGTPARAADVEAKFDWIEGNVNPMLAGIQADATYDLGTSSFRWRDLWISRDVVIANSGKLRLDGSSSGDTYIIEQNANEIRLFAGGIQGFTVQATQVFIPSANKFALDGGNDTYIIEGSSNNVTFTVGNNDVFTWITTGGGVFSTQKLFLDGGGNTYWVEGSADNVTLTVGGNDVYTNGSGIHRWLTGGGTIRLSIDNSGNIFPGTAALATSATNGFVYIQSCAGKPTGTPTDVTGRVPTIVDTSNNVPYFYANGAWRPMGQIIGVAAKAVTSTVLFTTQTALTISGQGRLRKLHLLHSNAIALSNVPVGVYLDGVAVYSGNFAFTASAGPGVVTLVHSAHNTSSSFFTNAASAIGSSAAFTTSSLLDVFFKSSMTIYFFGATSGAGATATSTAFIEYEVS